VTFADSTHIALSWVAPFDGGSVITLYKIYWDQGGSSFVLSGTSATQAFTQISVVAGTTYKFMVSAVNSIGESLQSDTVAMIAAEVPSAPQVPTKVSANQSQVTITWQAPFQENGSPVTTYSVYMDGAKVTSDPGVAGLTYTQTDGIVAGVLYTFAVTAHNGRGESDKSESVSIYAATVPSQPLMLAKTAAGKTFVSFNFTPPSTNGGSPILDFKVYWDAGAMDGVFVLLQASTGNLLTFTQTADIVVDGHYSFFVTAINAVGESPHSAELTIIAATVPG
jgi:hypothetical protein